ncbi:hypothetical protein BDV35DRAFT_378392 [Aspergillus flavus]|uniref:N-acetyltransferase domain-containing protein n=1 Tax=Aspergillus flavus TaxID=5059 RepID=A0A5N6H7W2_ASPFL|nr:hypothetical protein BDV35DRAFT_378392 [Aspergillus flavus]
MSLGGAESALLRKESFVDEILLEIGTSLTLNSLSQNHLHRTLRVKLHDSRAQYRMGCDGGIPCGAKPLESNAIFQAIHLSSDSRPDLWKSLEDPTHPLNAAWPLFLDQDIYLQHYCSQLSKIEAFACFQYAIVQIDDYDQEHIIACGRSLPFYWPELAKVGGKIGLAQHPKVLHTLPDEARTEPPNALSAISITVSPEYRSRGLAEALILAMKQAAIERNFDAMVVPQRPTRKSEFPTTDMIDYILWPATTVATHSPGTTVRKPDSNLPFDPWLRKHARLGAKVIKVARRSMRVEGSVEEWQQWTGVNIPQTTRQGLLLWGGCRGS